MSGGLITPRSAIAVAIDVLRPIFASTVPIASRAPTTLPARFVRVSRVGGQKDWALDRPMILVECFAQDDAEAPDSVAAEEMALTAYTALEVSRVPVYWEGGALAELDHPDYPRHSRFQFTGTLGVAVF